MKRALLLSLPVLLLGSCFTPWPLQGLYRCGGGCADGLLCDDGVCCKPGAQPACPTLVPASGTCLDGSAPLTWYPDKDGDGFGTTTGARLACSKPLSEPYVDNHDDCDDSSAEASPLGTEKCDGLDNNCDGRIDEGQTPVQTYYLDTDGDGYGQAGKTIEACRCPNGCVPGGYADQAGDCDDANPARHPGASEVCNGLDDDCNTLVDDGALAAPVGGACGDGGMGLCAAGTFTCAAGHLVCTSSYVPSLDVCDGEDNDCDGLVDEQPDCGGPTSLIGAGVVNGAQNMNKGLSFAESTTACLKNFAGATAETWSNPTWSGSDSTDHVWWAEAPAGKTWDLSTSSLKLNLELTWTMTSPAAGDAWDASKLPVVYLCGVNGAQMQRLVHIPGTLLVNSPQTVATTIDFSALGPTGWDRGASTGLDLTRVKRLEVLVKPAYKPPPPPLPTFTIRFSPDSGFVP